MEILKRRGVQGRRMQDRSQQSGSKASEAIPGLRGRQVAVPPVPQETNPRECAFRDETHQAAELPYNANCISPVKIIGSYSLEPAKALDPVTWKSNMASVRGEEQLPFQEELHAMKMSRFSIRLTSAVLVLAAVSFAQKTKFELRSLAPYVPSPQKVVERMLELADVKSTDTVYDLGAGDGRIVVTAAQKFGARAVGVEIDPDLVKKAEARLIELKLTDRAKVIQGDLLEVDLTPASVVTLYLLTASNRMLKPNLEKSLNPGSRVVSHDFEIDGWTPVSTETIRMGDRTHQIYVYEVGKH